MNTEELKQKYDELVAGIESARMFDGRNKGVDVYVCDKCGHKFYTRYKDKGVTPFTIKCRHCQHGTMVHDDTISEQIANVMGFNVHNWVRPTFDQLQKLNEGAIEHVLNGGLMLENELDGGDFHKLTAREQERQNAAECAYPYKGGVKGAICDGSIPIFIKGAEWADKTIIEKACNWLTLNIGMLLKVLDVEYNTNETDVKDFIEDFRKAMED